MKKEKSCGCIVFNEDNKVLLVKMNQGHWSFPKGHVEEGETEFQTALRETKEETNVDCEIVEGFREVVNYSPYPGIIKDVIFFVAKAKKSKLSRQVEEIAKTEYFTYSEAENLITFDNDRDLLYKAYVFIKKH